MSVIKSPDEFREQVKVGTAFWEVCSMYGGPGFISGPHIFTGFGVSTYTKDGETVSYEIIEYECPSIYGNGETIKSNTALIDLFNDKYKCIALSQKEADAFFLCCQIDFKNDPERQEQAEFEKFIDSLCDFDDDCDPFEDRFDD